MTIYDELIDVHAKGGDYTAQGVIVPSRRGQHDIVVETDLPVGRRLGVFVNGQFRTLSKVEADGTARASLTLPAGEVEVLFFDDRSQQGVRSYLTVRRTAAIAHAQAEVLTRVEADIDETQAALGLNGKTRRFLVPYLTRLGVTPPSSYDAEALREIARRLWTAYRRYYGSRLHLQRLSTFNGIEPLLLDRAYRPNWVAGGGLYWPSRWPRRRPFVGSLSALNGAAFNFVHDDYQADQALTFPGPITQPPEPQVLRVNFGSGWDGGAVTIRGQDQSGQIITERVPGVGAPAAPSVINTSTKFRSVLGISKQLVGVSSASVRIGLGTTRRFSIARVGPSLPVGTTYRIGTGPEVAPNDRRISDLAEGRTRVQLDGGQPVSVSSLPEPIAVTKSRIRFQIDKGPVQTIRLTPGSLTAADIVTAYSNQLGSAAKVTVVFGAPAQGSTTIIPHSGGTSDLTVEWIQTGDPLSPGSDVGAEVNYAGSASQATVTISGLAVGTEDTGIAIEYDDGLGGPLVYQYVWNTTFPPGTSQTSVPTLGSPIVTGYRTFSGFSTSNPPTSDPSTLIANAINAEAALPFTAAIDSPTQITLTYDTASSVPNGKEVYNVRRLPSPTYLLIQDGASFATWSGGGTSAPTTPEYAQALIDAIAASTAPLTATLVGADVEITQVSGGASNNGEVLSGTSGLTGTFAGGVDATSGSTQTQVGGGGDVAVLTAGQEIRLLPVGDDARFEVFGVPRRTQLSGSVSAGSRLVPVLNAERVYGGSVNVELARFLDDDTAPTFTALPFPTAIELVFDGWTAGDLVLEGTDFNRQLTSETFSPPAGGTGTVVGSVLFRTLTLIEPDAPAAVAAGSVGVRLAGGVETYGQPMRLGRDEALSSSTEVLTWTPQSVSGTALGAAASTVGGRVAWIQIDGGPNEGVHEVFGVNSSNAFVVANEFGGNFAPDSTARTWTLLASGEVVTAIGRTSTDVEVSEPLEFGYVAGALAEPDGAETDVIVQSIPDPDAWVDVDVDTRVPQVAGSTYTNLTVEGSVLPDGWQPRNADGVGYATTQGAFGNFPLIIDAPAAGDSSVSFFAGQASYVQGLPVRVTAWIEQVTEDTPQSFTVEISFDNGRTVGSRTRSIARSVVASGAAPFPGAPIRIDAQARVPTNAAPARIRIIWNDAPAGGRWYLHRTIVTAPLQTGYYLGTNTNVRTEHDANFGQVLYYWNPSEPYIAPGDTVPEDNAGLIEASRLLPAHLRWDLFDLSEFDAGSAVNVRGVYTDIEWDSCTLEGLGVSVALPDKHSSVVPTRLTQQTQDLSIGAPSNAALDVPANIGSGDLLPRAPGPNDILFLNGDPVPSASSSATFATATLAGGALTVTCELEGAAANSLEVSVVVGAGSVPLAVEVSNIGFSISLAVEEGVPDDEQNRIWTIASLINALDGYSASYDPADENVIVNTAETAFFSGASTTPWRYVSDSEIQIDPAELEAGGSYSLRYDGLIRATTPVIDLGDDWEDYFWFYDAPKWLRQETRVTEYERTQILEFRGDNTARLDEAADIEAGAVLILDNGIERFEIENFQFNDQRTVELLATPQNEVLYFFTYTARTGSFVSAAEVELEWRAAPTEVGVASALWRRFDSGTPAEPSRWWQLRATFTNVRSLNDCRLYGLGFKGINLYSDEPFAPGMGLRIEDPTLPPLAPPVITFDVVPLTVQDGGPVTISWSIAGTEPMQVELLADATPVYTGPLVANTLVVNPSWVGDPTQVTYTLNASNADGSSSTSETVIVVPTAPFISVTPGPGPHVIDPNVGTVNVPISWVSSGTQPIDLVINDGTTDIYTENGIAATDTITLPFSSAGTYTLTSTVNNPSGIPFTDVDVVVVELGVAPSVLSFTLSDTSLERGVDTTVITWNVDGSAPVTVTIEDNLGNVISTGTNPSSFATDTPTTLSVNAYTITATNAYGTDTATVPVTVFNSAPFPTLGRTSPGTIHTNDTVTLTASTSSGTPPITWEVSGNTLGVIASGTWNTKGEFDIVTSPVLGEPARFENFTLEVTNAVTTNTDIESVTVEQAMDLVPNGAFSRLPQGDTFPLTVSLPSGLDRGLFVCLTYDGADPIPTHAQLGTTLSSFAGNISISSSGLPNAVRQAAIYYFTEAQLAAGTTTNQLRFSDSFTSYTFDNDWAVHLYRANNVGNITFGGAAGVTGATVIGPVINTTPFSRVLSLSVANGNGSAHTAFANFIGTDGSTSGGTSEIRTFEGIPDASGQLQIAYTDSTPSFPRVGYCYVIVDPV